MKTLVSPSLLAADFKNLEKELKRVQQAGADMLHFDVMDGVFVPNISYGMPLLAAMKSCTTLPFDVHLMIISPLKYIEEFAKAGADLINFHLESEDDPSLVIAKIKECGKKVGITIKPGTDYTAVLPYLDEVDMVLIMSVEPGFGGQSFMDNCLEKISKLRSIISERNLNVDIQVDGGINEVTGKKVREAGANVLVAGSYIFSNKDITQAIESLR